MTQYLLPRGLSFSDPELLSKSVLSQANLVFDPKMKEQERVDMLINSIERNRLDVVEQVIASLNPKKLAGPQMIMRVVKAAAANNEISNELLDFLDQKRLLNRHNFIMAIDDNRNWGAGCWLLRDRENIDLTEINLPNNYVRAGKDGKNVRSAAGMLGKIAAHGLAGKLSKLDIGYILRNEKPRHAHEGSNIFRAALRSAPTPLEDLVSLAEVIWDPATYRLMYDQAPDKEIEFETVKAAKDVILRLMFDETDGLDEATKIENIAAGAPKFAAVLEKYWKLPQEVLLANHPGKWGPVDTQIISENLPGIRAPHDRDLLDCAIRCGSDWVQRSMLEQGKIQDEIWRRLKEDDGPLVAGAIRSIAPTDIQKYVGVFIDNLGTDWKDPQGRGLGHYFLMASNTTTAELVKTIARSKEGIGLLSQTDENGMRAISSLEKHEDWKAQYKQDVLDKTKHKILEHIAASQSVERKPVAKPVF